MDYRGPLDCTAETLRQLQIAHLLSVPFENLSIHWGQPVILEDQALFEKVVMRRRGGFCYELNGLFAALLRALGFEVVMLSAGVVRSSGELGPEFDHMTLMVTLDERWLVDVGFGDAFREPLLLDERAAQTQGERAYRIDTSEDRLILMQRDRGSDWRARYQFRLSPRAYPDYAEMCRYHQTSPDSIFTQGRICVRATPEGCVWLSKMQLVSIRSGERNERELANEEEYAEALREHFGIVMPSLAPPALRE
jgi:N-hydroxyarylamine O-acetyltransferase